MTTHTNKEHAEKVKAGDTSDTTIVEMIGSSSTTKGASMASVQLMQAFVEEGKLNPKIEPTQKGFQKMFTAWCIEDNLPWTTGETDAIARLWKYLKIDFRLPSDTTMRNTVKAIHDALHCKLVEELTVSTLSILVSYVLTIHNTSYLIARSHTQATHGPIHK